MTTPENPHRIPEERVSAILTRAAELDRKVQEGVELDAIRAAAVEAGISLSSVDRALEEYAADMASTHVESATLAPPEPGLMRRWLGRFTDHFKYSLLGLLSGLIATRGESAITIPLIVLFLVALRIILQDRPTGRIHRFVEILTLTTLAASFGYISEGNADEEVVAFMLTLSAALLPIGVLAIKTVARKPLEPKPTT